MCWREQLICGKRRCVAQFSQNQNRRVISDDALTADYPGRSVIRRVVMAQAIAARTATQRHPESATARGCALATVNVARQGLHYELPAHVRACARREGTVLLDLRKNRYFAVGSAESALLSTVVANWPRASTSSCAANTPTVVETADRYASALIRAELLSMSASLPSLGTLEVAVPQAAIGEEIIQRSAVSICDVTRFFRARRWARRSVRSCSFEAIAQAVDALRKGKETCAVTVVNSEVVRLVCVFRTLRPATLKARGQCLVHSLALLRFLVDYGVIATWVVGVRLRPWGAHSWLQIGEYVLDATPDDVSGFDPILAV